MTPARARALGEFFDSSIHPCMPHLDFLHCLPLSMLTNALAVCCAHPSASIDGGRNDARMQPTTRQALLRCYLLLPGVPLRMPVHDVARGKHGQVSVGGKLEAGALKVGSRVLLLPGREVGTVKQLEVDGQVSSRGHGGMWLQAQLQDGLSTVLLRFVTLACRAVAALGSAAEVAWCLLKHMLAVMPCCAGCQRGPGWGQRGCHCVGRGAACCVAGQHPVPPRLPCALRHHL